MSLFGELKRRNVLRVAIAYLAGAWLLVEVTDTVFPYFGLGENAVRVLIILLAIGFPLFLVFSWVFEFTPEGLRLEKDIDRTAPVTRKAGKNLDRAIIVLLVLAVGYFAVDKFVLDPARDAALVVETAQQARSEALVESYGDNSIAVLPFADMSPQGDQEYFSDGISEELLNLLAQIPELRVISRSSAFSFKGKDIAIPEVAKQLNVAHILEGSVRKAGDRVRITAQLIEARSDTHLWSENYDRTLDDIFTVQDEIAAAISAALELELGLAGVTSPTAIATSNSLAYDAYLRGRELAHHRDRENLEEAVKLLQRSVNLDDTFAPAHAQLAIATMLLTAHVSSDREMARRIAARHLDRAQELEPDLPEAHAGRALLANFADEPAATIEHAQKALAVNPNHVEAMHWMRSALIRLGRDEEAHAVLERMLATDPLSIIGRAAYAGWLTERGRYEDAHDLADQLIVQSPTSGYRVHARTYLWGEGKLAEALYWALKVPRDGYSHAWNILTVVGEYDEARRVVAGRIAHWVDANQGHWDKAIQASLREVELSPDSGPMIADAAELMYRAGRLDEAVALYERALVLAPEGLQARGFSPSFMIQQAVAQRKTGNEERAQAAARVARQENAARRAAGNQGMILDAADAMIAAFDQDQGGAIAAIESAMQHGLRWLQFFDDPVFEELQDDARFIAVRHKMEAIVAAEHEKVLQLICFNNPVPDEWQPMPETCEGVVMQ